MFICLKKTCHTALQNLSPSTPGTDTPLCLIPRPVGGITQEQLSVISRFALASVGSQGTVGGLIVAGIVRIYAL